MLHIKKVTPQFTAVVTTAETFKEDYERNGLLVFSKGSIKPWQTVVAVGTTVRDIQPGDKVMISFDRYAIKRYDPNSLKEDMGLNKTIDYNVPSVDIDDADGNSVKHLLIDCRDILYTFEGEELQDKKSSPIIQVPPLILK